MGTAPRSSYPRGSTSKCTAVAVSKNFECGHHADVRDAGFSGILWVDRYREGYQHRNEGMFCMLEHNTAFHIESGMVVAFDAGGGVKHGTLAVNYPDLHGDEASRYGLGIYAKTSTIQSYTQGMLQTVPGGGSDTFIREVRLTRGMKRRRASATSGALPPLPRGKRRVGRRRTG